MSLTVAAIKTIRESLSNAAIEGEAEYLRRIRKLRQETASLVASDALAPAVFAKFTELWNFLSKDPTGDYYLPALYISDDIDKVLQIIVVHLLRRERKRLRFGSSDNTGHAVLGGVEGSGKTTILRAIVYAVAFLFDRLFPVCIEYSERSCPLPSTQIRVACAELDIHLPPDEVGPHISADDQLKGMLGAVEQRHSVLLVLDEFQHAFTDADTLIPLSQRLNATAEVTVVSRFGNSYVLIAGSSADMRSLMFQRGSRESPDKWRRLGYPDFNGSLYLLYTIPALRDVRTLKQFLSRRYPNWRVSDPDVAELMYYTGGVGRFVHEVFQNAGVTNDHSAVEGVHSAIAYLVSSLRVDGRHDTPFSAYSNNINLRIIATYIIELHERDIDADRARDRHQLPCIGTAMTEVTRVLRKLDNTCDPRGVIHSLVDKSLLYVDEARNIVQLTRPADAHVYTDHGEHGVKEMNLYIAVQFMLHGIAAEAGHIIHVNAGTPLEKLTRRYIHRILWEMKLVATASDITVRTAAGVIEVKLTPSDAWRRLDAEILSQLDGRVAKWDNETGLDGLVFQRQSDILWHLHGWQCNGGHVKVEITGGAMKTSISAYAEDGVVSGLDDSTSHGILVKAQVGFIKLIAAWHATFPSTTPALLPASLLITTTKNASKARVSIEKEVASGMKIDSKVAATALNGRPAWLRGVLSAKCRISLEDGLAWLQRCLPSSLTEALPLPITSADETMGPLGISSTNRCVVM